MYTVADQLVEILEKAGVKRIYGIVGDSLNPITDALRRKKTIEWIHMRHEEVGAFAASAEAQLTGNLAVCCGSSGPGNLHLINGLYDAHRSRARVLAIACEDARLDEVKRIGLGPGRYCELHGHEYASDYLLPNLYFHLTTTYAILRMLGAPLGKADFMAHLAAHVRQDG